MSGGTIQVLQEYLFSGRRLGRFFHGICMSTVIAPIIEIKNVTKVYSTVAGDFSALNGINLRVDKGEFLGVVGKSGAGKSTLLNMITGVDHLTSGEVIVRRSMAWWRMSVWMRVSRSGPVTDVLPDVKLTGTVQTISGAFTKQGGDIVYNVRILVDSPIDPRIRWGMTVEATFALPTK